MAVKKSAKKAARKAAPTSASSRKAKPAGKAQAATSKGRPRPSALKMREVSPGFTANDLQKSLAFYRDVLGFSVESRWEVEGVLRGVELKAGDVIFMLGQDDWKKGRNRKKGEGFRLYCETTQDVDAVAAGIVARGGKLDQEPRDQSWGYRDFALTDPDGFKITVGKVLKKKR